MGAEGADFLDFLDILDILEILEDAIRLCRDSRHSLLADSGGTVSGSSSAFISL